MSVVYVHPEQYEEYNGALKAFEEKLSQWYPFTDTQFFRIDHGRSYLQFFQRMGNLYYYVLKKDNVVFGTVCFVFRRISQRTVCYICDLKLDPTVRKQNYVLRFMLKALPWCLTQTRQFYAISMNQPNKTNHMLTLAQKWASRCCCRVQSHTLNIYCLDYFRMALMSDRIHWYKNKKVFYKSLENVKDLLWKHDNTSMKILHSCDESDYTYTSEQDGYDHMFCTLSTSPLSDFLKQHFKLEPMSTATIISINMRTNWEWIQTCDI